MSITPEVLNNYSKTLAMNTKINAILNLNFHLCNFIMIEDSVGLGFNHFPCWT